MTTAPASTGAPAGRWDRYQLAALAAILATAAAMRVPTLGLRQLVEGDGVHYASLAREALAGDFSGLANPYWSNLWPGVIAGTSLLTGLDVVGAGRLASLVAGVALSALTALLGLRLFGRFQGLAAGLAVAIHPWLVQFSTLVFTESFFSLLLVCVLLAGWAAICSPEPGRSALAGLLAGAAVVTRPEAFGAIGVVAVSVAAVAWRRGGLGKAVAALLPLLLVVAAFLSLRAALVHHYFGEWDFGIQFKGTANLIVGLAPSDAEKERASSELTPDGQSKLNASLRRWTLVSFTLAHPRLVLSHVGDNVVVLAASSRRVFPPLPVSMGREAFRGTPLWSVIDLASLACLALGLVGFVGALRAPATRRGAALCGGVLALHLVGLSPLYVHDRLIVAVVPPFLVLFAHGLAVVARGAKALVGSLLFLLLAGLSLHGQLKARTFDYASEPVVQRDVGLWLRERFPQDLRLMTVSPSIAFYFYDARHQQNEVSLPWAEYPALVAFAQREGVDLVAASEWQLTAAGFPAASQLVPASDHPGLGYLATRGDEPYRVHIFRVEPGSERPQDFRPEP